MIRFPRFFLLPLLFMLSLLAVGAPARAMDMYSYDLDSLVYLSSDIVDADPLSRQNEGGLDITNVKVTKVYLGHFHVGEIIKVTAVDFFRVEDQGGTQVIRGAGGRHIGVGDHVTLFLSKAHSVFLYNIPKAADIYWPAPSGVKMLDQSRIKGFEQYSNPGPYELEWTTPDTLKTLPTPEQFQAQLTAAINQVEPLRPLLTKNATASDEPKLLQLLRQRAQMVFPRQSRLRDAISEAAASQIVSLHDLDATGNALAIVRDENLTRTLQTPSGRDFLLRVIGDSRQPHDRRLGCARALYSAFSWWDIPANSDYLPRIVSLCGHVQDTTDITAALLGQLDALAAFDDRDAKPPHEYPVIESGLPMLRRLDREREDGAVRFAVEKLIVDTLGYAAYQALNSPCGPVISLAQPGDLPSAAGKLNYQASIRWADAAWYTSDRTATLVLVNVKSKKRYTLPEGRSIDFWTDGDNDHSTMQADLPPSLPHGRYHVFLEFTRPHHPVSVGYGYDTEL